MSSTVQCCEGIAAPQCDMCIALRRMQYRTGTAQIVWARAGHGFAAPSEPSPTMLRIRPFTYDAA
jgi:hypothetical protein